MLNDAERRRTKGELDANLHLAGLTPAEVAVDLQLTPDRLRAALQVGPQADPVDVWQLRDYLEQAVEDAGRQPIAYTVLTESSRRLARSWFPLRTAPRHPRP